MKPNPYAWLETSALLVVAGAILAVAVISWRLLRARVARGSLGAGVAVLGYLFINAVAWPALFYGLVTWAAGIANSVVGNPYQNEAGSRWNGDAALGLVFIAFALAAAAGLLSVGFAVAVARTQSSPARPPAN